MDVALIRHPAPDIAPGICYGVTDLMLKPGWQKVLVRAQHALAASGFGQRGGRGKTRFISSPLKRCMVFAEALAQVHEWPDPDIEPDLRELNFGHWEMRAWDDMPREQIDAWAHDVLHFSPPNGEAAADLILRVQKWMARYIDVEHPPARLMVVTHAGVIRTLASLWLDLPLTQTLNWDIDYGGVCLLRITPKSALEDPHIPRCRLLAWNR